MSEDFAKLFNIEGIGQVVVMLQGADETGNPEIRCFAAPEGLGVCSIAVQTDNDSDDTWDRMEALLKSRNEENILPMIKPLLDAANGIFA